jgi:hypothetical protein
MVPRQVESALGDSTYSSVKQRTELVLPNWGGGIGGESEKKHRVIAWSRTQRKDREEMAEMGDDHREEKKMVS